MCLVLFKCLCLSYVLCSSVRQRSLLKLTSISSDFLRLALVVLVCDDEEPAAHIIHCKYHHCYACFISLHVHAYNSWLFVLCVCASYVLYVTVV